MPTLQFTVGNPGSPTANTDTYFHENLRNAIVDFAIIDNVPMNGLHPDPDYTSSPIEATLKLEKGNKFILGMKGIIHYSTCKPC